MSFKKDVRSEGGIATFFLIINRFMSVSCFVCLIGRGIGDPSDRGRTTQAGTATADALISLNPSKTASPNQTGTEV